MHCWVSCMYYSVLLTTQNKIKAVFLPVITSNSLVDYSQVWISNLHQALFFMSYLLQVFFRWILQFDIVFLFFHMYYIFSTHYCVIQVLIFFFFCHTFCGYFSGGFYNLILCLCSFTYIICSLHIVVYPSYFILSYVSHRSDLLMLWWSAHKHTLSPNQGKMILNFPKKTMCVYYTICL
jgi:hypothetical protein